MRLNHYQAPSAKAVTFCTQENLLILSDFGQTGYAGSGFEDDGSIIDIPDSF